MPRFPVKIKICGMTNRRDAELAARLGADAVGFIFYKKSPRYISEKAAREIAAVLPPFVARVGVFVDETAERINRIVACCRLDYAQLHGEEPPEFCRQIACKTIKAVRVRDSGSLAGLEKYRVDGFLLDAFSAKGLGGTGETFDWKLARAAKRRGPIILAGGLTPENVADAIRRTQPHGVDVCSGVEKSPGKKDAAKLKKFIAAAREGMFMRRIA
jgi:phosphoribosylanthranilate isomerase